MKSKLSILGLYEYNADVFSGLQLPEKMSRALLIDYIFMECADLELLYPDWDWMKRLISSWSIARLHSWERLYDSTVQEYNMIHNYDRYEQWSDNGNRDENIDVEDTATGSANGEAKRSLNKPGYNIGNGAVTTEQETTDTTTRSTEARKSFTKDSANHVDIHSGHMYGNIGVTTAAQMLQGERDINDYDVYWAITQEFKHRFCIMVY